MVSIFARAVKNIVTCKKYTSPILARLHDTNKRYATTPKKFETTQTGTPFDCIIFILLLDPAVGSGNFLTESYLSLRRLENEVIGELQNGEMTFGFGGELDPIKVSIHQFYGIEINDFAVAVSKAALWIAESQALQETENIVHTRIEFLPLKSYANIVEGNALRIDWGEVIPKEKCAYIIGNPPFVGNSRLSEEQKQDRQKIFSNNGGDLDYVACWYKKAADFIKDENIRCAFVSTNSICQGQQVMPLWQPLMNDGIKINFAHRTFVWDSESNSKAHVYCVIVGFSRQDISPAFIYSKNQKIPADNINGYLLNAPNIFISKRKSPICDVPKVIKGFQPTDNGYLILDDNEKEEILAQTPQAAEWIRPFITAKEYIHGKNRWCLWLVNIPPNVLNKLTKIKERVIACREWRLNQPKTGDAYKLRDIPALMRPSSQFTEADFIVIPRHSGENRRYIPFGFVEKGCIPGDSISLAIGATIYHFSVICSNVHMAWTRAVCGRLEMRYRYTSDIVYNNFPWSTPNEKQKAAIEKTAQEILNVRKLYPDSSLADLYNEALMPPELRKAHQANDRAVMAAYGFSVKDMTEAACVAELMKMYKELTKKV